MGSQETLQKSTPDEEILRNRDENLRLLLLNASQILILRGIKTKIPGLVVARGYRFNLNVQNLTQKHLKDIHWEAHAPSNYDRLGIGVPPMFRVQFDNIVVSPGRYGTGNPAIFRDWRGFYHLEDGGIEADTKSIYLAIQKHFERVEDYLRKNPPFKKSLLSKVPFLSRYKK